VIIIDDLLVLEIYRFILS